MHLKALTLASPLPGSGVGWDRGKQQQRLKCSSVCAGWVGDEISTGTNAAGDDKATSLRSQTGEPSAAYLLGDPSRTVSLLLAGLIAPPDFGGQITSVLGWCFRFCLLSLSVSKDLKEML